MALVTIYTPTQMDNLAFPALVSRGPSFSTSHVEKWTTSLPDQMYMAMYFTGLSIAPSAKITGTINTAIFDTMDVGYAPNIIITGLNLVLTDVDNFNLHDEYATLLPRFLAGADTFNGSNGADLMTGFSGNDTFFGGGGADTYNGGGDRDTVSYEGAGAALFAGLEDSVFNRGEAAGDSYISIENLIGTAFNDVLYGNGDANRLTAGNGNDLMVGKAGADTLDGGAGSDTVSYDASSTGVRADLMTQSANTHYATGDTYISIENLDGGSYNDILLGNDFANVLRGNTYRTPGNSDQDQLYGRGGNDTLDGCGGRDTYSGGGGADRFVFKLITDTGKTAATRDIIKDFTHNAQVALSDRIDLTGIDAKAGTLANDSFTFIGTSSFSGLSGQLRYRQENPADTVNDKTIVEADINGDKVIDFAIELSGLKTLVSVDFIL